jgi:hypothetical protein
LSCTAGQCNSLFPQGTRLTILAAILIAMHFRAIVTVIGALTVLAAILLAMH